MFGFGKVDKAINMASDAVNQLLAPLQFIQGFPPGFWRDPYVLGYIQGCIGMFASFSSRNTLHGAQLGRVVVGVFDRLTRGQGTEVTRDANSFFQRQDPDFLLGMDRGSKSVMIAFGSKSFENDDDYVRAQKLAETMPELGVNQQGELNVGGAYQFLYFSQVVEERLGK